MTAISTQQSKSRRAHSTCLADPKREALFDADEFCEIFDKLNPGLTVWDSIEGVFL